MRQFNKRLVVTAFSLMVLALGACAPTHVITVHRDGTFDPQTLEINEGDMVIWAGNGFTFANTDAIARIGLPHAAERKSLICGAAAGGTNENITLIPEVNFSGPKRKGISGIYVLAPEGHGHIETSTSNLTATCNDVLDSGNDPNVDYQTGKTVDSAGTRYLLCAKKVLIGREWVPAADPTQGAISQVVPSVWDNPGIDGVVLRVRWSDFQYHDGTSVVTVWDDIDRAFREAIKRGKMISINFHAGKDTPTFIFNDYDINGSTPSESNVEPVFLRDYATDSVTPPGCGSRFKLGSPNDPNYVAKIKGLYDALAAHVKDDARFFQALGYVKVTGLNLFTGEARLPNRCLDPDAGADHHCKCNTKIWAEDTAEPPPYRYTPTGLYTFYNDIENHIFSSFMGEKSLHYMLIQAGFPRVLDENNYFRDALHDGDDGIAGTADDLGADGIDGTSDDGFVGSGFPGPFTQTVNVLLYGRLGRFALPGDPTLLPDDLATGKLFVAQHSGLSLHPRDKGIAQDCPQTVMPNGTVLHEVFTDANGKNYHDVYTAGVPDLGDVGSGCPNEWAAEQGYLGQIIGFQTKNDVDDPNEVDSSLWNMMSASNAVYYEIYEDAAWVIAKQKGTGPNAAVLDTAAGYFPMQGAGWQKNLNQWGQQLHQRRENLASLYSTYPHMANPFPDAHSHRFSQPLNPGEVRDFWYINPGRCMASPSAQPYGHIKVNGQ